MSKKKKEEQKTKAFTPLGILALSFLGPGAIIGGYLIARSIKQKKKASEKEAESKVIPDVEE